MSRTPLRLQDVRRLLRSSVELELSQGAVQRLKWFLYCLEHGDNVSLTCRHFGISRSTYLRWAERFDATNLRSLEESSRRPINVRRPETDARIVELVKAIRSEQPLLGKDPITVILRERHGINVSTSTVGRVISRHKLFFADRPSHEQKRLVVTDAVVPSPAHHDVLGSTPREPEDFSDPLSLFPVSSCTS